MERSIRLPGSIRVVDPICVIVRSYSPTGNTGKLWLSIYLLSERLCSPRRCVGRYSQVFDEVRHLRFEIIVQEILILISSQNDR